MSGLKSRVLNNPLRKTFKAGRILETSVITEFSRPTAGPKSARFKQMSGLKSRVLNNPRSLLETDLSLCGSHVINRLQY